MKSDKHYIFCTNTTKSSKHFNQVIIIMEVFIDDKKLIIITEQKSIRFDLPIV